MYHATLAVGSPVIRAAFSSMRALPNACDAAREWSSSKGRHNVSTRWWYWQRTATQPHRPAAMRSLFAGRYEPWLRQELQRVRATLPPIHTVIHLRTGAEFHCARKLSIGSCGQCVPPRSLRCAHANVIGKVALLFTDHSGSQLRQLLVHTSSGAWPSKIMYHTEEELNMTGLSRLRFSLSTQRNPRTFSAVMWALAYEAPHFIGSASSTLSKSIAMARVGEKSTVLVDMRCKHRRGDGVMFACRNATLSDLV